MKPTEGPPRRARGRARLSALLDAADELLLNHEAAEISFSDIAKLASVPVASIYHYFPSPAVLFESLARRHLERIETVYDTQLTAAQSQTWMTMLRSYSELARAYYTANPAVMRLFLGPDVGWKIRQSDLETNLRFGRRQNDLLHRAFHIPADPLLPETLALSLSIADAVWSVSYIRFGTVTDAMAEEAYRARMSYLSLYLPPQARRRDG